MNNKMLYWSHILDVQWNLSFCGGCVIFQYFSVKYVTSFCFNPDVDGLQLREIKNPVSVCIRDCGKVRHLMSVHRVLCQNMLTGGEKCDRKKVHKQRGVSRKADFKKWTEAGVSASFGLPGHILLLVHCDSSGPESIQPSTRICTCPQCKNYWEVVY